MCYKKIAENTQKSSLPKNNKSNKVQGVNYQLKTL